MALSPNMIAQLQKRLAELYFERVHANRFRDPKNWSPDLRRSFESAAVWEGVSVEEAARRALDKHERRRNAEIERCEQMLGKDCPADPMASIATLRTQK